MNTQTCVATKDFSLEYKSPNLSVCNVLSFLEALLKGERPEERIVRYATDHAKDVGHLVSPPTPKT